jgi:hypothetical protein
MTTKERLAAAKAGKRVTTSTGKTQTTTKGGWSITTGVQKKTLSPKRKSRPSTAGKTIKYHGGRSTVIDLGHNPTKSAISTATTKLRSATKTTKPKAKKNTASSVPTVKIPQEGAPTVPSPKKSEGTSLSTKIAVGTVIGGGAAVGATALLKGSKKPAEVKLPRKNLPAPQLGLPGGKAGSGSIQYDPPKNLPAPPKGLPGPEKKVSRRQIVDDLRAKSAPKVAKVVAPTAPKAVAKTPTLSERHDARRAKQGAGLKSAFEMIERVDARKAKAAPTAPKTIKPLTDTTVARVTGVGSAKPRAPKRAAVPRHMPKTSKAGVPKIEAPKVPSATAGFGATEADIAKVAKSGEAVKAPSAKKAAEIKTTVAAAPKEVKTMVAEIDKAAAPKIARVSPDILGGLSANQGKLPPVVKGVAPPKADPTIPKVKSPEAPKANVAPQPKVGRVTAGGTEAKDVYKEARDALRSGDTGRMKAAVGKLPEGTKKTAKFTQNLEAGIQAAGNRPPPSTPAPKADAPAPEAPKVEAPKVARVEGVPAPAAPKNLKRDLARAQATNVKLKADVAKVEAPKSTAPISDTAPEATKAAVTAPQVVKVEPLKLTEEQRAAGKRKVSTKRFYKKQGQARRAARDASIAEKGIMTIPTDAEAGSVEGEEAKQRRIQNDLLDATLAEDRGRVTTAPKTVGGADRRTAAEIVGEKAVAEKTRVIDMVAPDLEAEHGGARQRGTIGDLIAEDKTAQLKRGELVRAAAGKARNIAASRDASPAQMEKLEVAVDAEYDRALETYFDDVEPKNQRGPRKPDARPRLLDSMIEADAELARERGAASPPAPSDRTTIDQKIAEVKKRIAPGGETVYRGEDTLRMLENLRDQKPVEVKPLKSTRVLPSAGAAAAEQFSKDRPSIRAAAREGQRAGERAAKVKRVSGAAGPVKVPDMTKPGVIPAGPKTPPAEPARERGVVRGPPKTVAQLWTGRMAEWGRRAYQKQIKKLTSPAVEVAGEKAKGTFSTEARLKAAKGLGVAAVGFSALGAAEAGAKEYDPKKRLSAAGKQFKEDLPDVTKSIALFTGADILVSKAVPVVTSAAAKTVMTKAGVEAAKVASRAAFVRGASAFLGKAALGAYIGYHAIPFAIDQSKKLASAIGEAQFDKGEAAREKKTSEAKYGTVELATKTRHAKEAYKKRLALEAKRKK